MIPQPLDNNHSSHSFLLFSPAFIKTLIKATDFTIQAVCFYTETLTTDQCISHNKGRKCDQDLQESDPGSSSNVNTAAALTPDELLIGPLNWANVRGKLNRTNYQQWVNSTLPSGEMRMRREFTCEHKERTVIVKGAVWHFREPLFSRATWADGSVSSLSYFMFLWSRTLSLLLSVTAEHDFSFQWNWGWFSNLLRWRFHMMMDITHSTIKRLSE